MISGIVYEMISFSSQTVTSQSQEISEAELRAGHNNCGNTNEYCWSSLY